MSPDRPPTPDDLLAPVLEAGWTWQVRPFDPFDPFAQSPPPEMTPGDAEAQHGGRHHSLADWEAVLRRGMVEVAVVCMDDVLTFGPRLEPTADDTANLLDTDLRVYVEDDLCATVLGVRELAAATGMLDLVDVAAVGERSTEQVMLDLVTDLVLVPAATSRAVSGAHLLAELQDTVFPDLLDGLRLTSRRPMPDAVPPVAALGIAGQAWRDTAVEHAHSQRGSELTDAVMARLNIAATRIARRHCTVDGVDWPGVEAELLDGDRTVTGGRRVAELFGSSWAACARSVADALGALRAVDGVLGPAPTVRYLSVLGSLPSTALWWGTGAWIGMCGSVLETRAAAAVPLPAPYDRSGYAALYRDLLDVPDQLSDEVFWFCMNPLEFEGDRFFGVRDAPVPRPAIIEFGGATG